MRKQRKRLLRGAIAIMLVCAVGIMVTMVRCGGTSGSSSSTAGGGGGGNQGVQGNAITTTAWLAGISAAQWATAEGAPVTVTLNDAGTFTATPQELTFTAGEPYVLRLINSGTGKHYFTATEFYKSIALRKVQTDQAEYKAPYITAIEVLAGGQVDIYFVAVATGKYAFICTIGSGGGSHANGGMSGTIEINNDNSLADTTLDLEIDAAYDPMLDFAPERSGSHAVWTGATAVSVEYGDALGATLSYYIDGGVVEGEDLLLTVDTGYIITLTNPDAAKHYWNSDKDTFFQTVVWRKAQDANAEIKAPYFKAVELRGTGVNTVELFVVPKVAATYYMYCSILDGVPGSHEGAGMFHNVIVSGTTPALGAPMTTSDWLGTISAAQWATAEGAPVTVTLNDAGTFTATPQELTFTAGEPYVLRLINSGTGKHYFTAQEFYRSIALRKVQTDQAEYKAPYVTAIEVLSGGQVDIYFVAVATGKYPFICTIGSGGGSHANGGMSGTIEINNDNSLADTSLDQEIDAAYNTILDQAPERSGSHAVWTGAAAVSVEYGDAGATTLSYYIDGGIVEGEDLPLTVDTGYIITLTNPDMAKHYWNSDKDIFFQTVVWRKAQDADAEIKAPYFKAIELRSGAVNTVELFVVPKVAATYYMYCSILDGVPGSHEAAGMFHNVIVN